MYVFQQLDGGRRQPSFKTDQTTVKETGTDIKFDVLESDLEKHGEVEGSSEVMCLRYNNDGTHIAAGYADGAIRVYSSASPYRNLYNLFHADYARVPLPCTSLRYFPATNDRKNILMATYCSGHVRFWHVPSAACIKTIDEGRLSTDTMGSAFNTTGEIFATVGADPQVHVYDMETKKRVSTLQATDSRDKMDGHRSRVFAIQFHPTEPTVALTGGWDNTVHFWDTRQRHSFRNISGPHICGDAIDIDPNNNQILTGSWTKESALQIWDYGSTKKIRDIPETPSQVSQMYCCQWLGKDSLACGGTNRNMARLIDRNSMITIGQIVDMRQGVYCMDNDRQSNKPTFAVGALRTIYFLRIKEIGIKSAIEKPF